MSLENNSMVENALTEAISSSFLEQTSWPSVLANASAEIGRHSESVMLSVPQSPSIEHLRRVPKSELAADSAAGQALRRKIMRGSVVVFIGAGSTSKKMIYDVAKEMGVQSVVIDSPGCWVERLQTEGIITKFAPMDLDIDPEMLFGDLVKLISEIGDSLGGIDGVCTFCEVATPLTARVCEALGLPGNPSNSVDLARDKHACRRALEEAGLPTPANHLITDTEDLDAAAAKVGFPAVIKPVAGAASLGVIRVENIDELKTSYANVVREMRKYKVTSGLLVAGAEEDEEDGNAAGWVKPRVLMEEYLDGAECDIDCVMADGEVKFAEVSDNWPTQEPYFNESGAQCPSLLPEDQVAALISLSKQSLVAAGFTTGVFHVEAKFTSRGARLVEINPRMGGGGVFYTLLYTWGVNLIEEQMMASVGLPCCPQRLAEPKAVAYSLLNSWKTGKIMSTDWCAKWAALPGVHHCNPLIKAGTMGYGIEKGMPIWLCELLVVKPTAKEACAYIEEIIANKFADIPIE